MDGPWCGDDVAAIKGKGRSLVVKVDMLVERTDVPSGMSYRQAARKAVAACVSDFAAKGVAPLSFLASVGVKRGTSRQEAAELGKGFRDAEKEWDVDLVGGDTNETEQLIIDCAMFGWGNRVVGRRGAVPGELLVVTGKFGLPPAGLKILAGRTKVKGDFERKAVRSVLEPTPNLGAGLAAAKFLTSSMDSSDGLARSLHTLAGAGGVGFELTKLPVANGVREYSEGNHLDAERLVLEGGEEYLVVGTLKEGDYPKAEKAVSRAGGDLIPIGVVTPKAREVTLRTKGRTRKIRDAGWTHLRGR